MTQTEKNHPSLNHFEKAFPQGAKVFGEHDEGKEMFVIREGKVEVSISVRGKKKVLATLQKGEFFGEMAVLNNKPRSATVVCVEDCRLLALGAKAFEKFLRNDNEACINLIKKLSERLQRSDDIIENLMMGDDDSMVVNTLKKVLEESDTVTSDGLVLDASPDELAQRIGLDIEKIKVVLTKLKRLELIAIKGKSIIIPSKQRLLKYAQLLEVQADFLKRGLV